MPAPTPPPPPSDPARGCREAAAFKCLAAAKRGLDAPLSLGEGAASDRAHGRKLPKRSGF